MGYLKHFQGFLATLLAPYDKRRDWNSHNVNYSPHVSRGPRAISRCDYDAELLLTSLTGATQKKKHVADLTTCF